MGYLDGSGLSYLWRKIRSAIGAQATPRNLLDNSDFTHPIAQAGIGGLHMPWTAGSGQTARRYPLMQTD